MAEALLQAHFGGHDARGALKLGASNYTVSVSKSGNKRGNDDEVCEICAEEIDHGDKVYKLSCNHFYHHDCLYEYTEHVYNALQQPPEETAARVPRCGVCRARVNAREMMDILGLKFFNWQEVAGAPPEQTLHYLDTILGDGTPADKIITFVDPTMLETTKKYLHLYYFRDMFSIEDQTDDTTFAWEPYTTPAEVSHSPHKRRVFRDLRIALQHVLRSEYTWVLVEHFFSTLDLMIRFSCFSLDDFAPYRNEMFLDIMTVFMPRVKTLGQNATWISSFTPEERATVPFSIRDRREKFDYTTVFTYLLHMHSGKFSKCAEWDLDAFSEWLNISTLHPAVYIMILNAMFPHDQIEALDPTAVASPREVRVVAPQGTVRDAWLRDYIMESIANRDLYRLYNAVSVFGYKRMHRVIRKNHGAVHEALTRALQPTFTLVENGFSRYNHFVWLLWFVLRCGFSLGNVVPIEAMPVHDVADYDPTTLSYFLTREEMDVY